MMFAIQYEIALPADYNMEIIRRRVENGGSAYDHYQGLGLKAFLIQDKNEEETPVNQYATFYLWTDTQAASKFLWGGNGFQAIVRDFGRPTVQTWLGGKFSLGNSSKRAPAFLVKETTKIPAFIDPQDSAAVANQRMNQLLQNSRLHSTAYAMNPTTWELIVVSLWTEKPALSVESVLYRILHLSTPEITSL